MFFVIWSMFWNISQIYFSFLAYKSLSGSVTLFFSNFYQSSDWKCIPSHLYFFIKGLIFVSFSGFFPFFSWHNATVTAYWKHLLSFISIWFIFAFFFSMQSGESIYDLLRFGFIWWRDFYYHGRTASFDTSIKLILVASKG